MNEYSGLQIMLGFAYIANMKLKKFISINSLRREQIRIKGDK